MRRRHNVVARMVDRFAPDIFDCEGEDDVNKLIEFQQATFGLEARQSQPKFTHWAYLCRPGNVLNYCVRNGDIVGQQGRLQTTLHVGEKDYTAVWATDLRVRDDWKMKGLGVALIGKVLRDNPIVMAIGISPEARTMFHRQGWIVLDRIDALLKPLAPNGFRYSDSEPTLWKNVLGHALYWAFKPLDHMMMAVVRLKHRGARIVSVERLDESIQPLLTQRRAQARVCCDRSIEFLNWRFVDSPFAHRYRRYALWVGEDMRGFVVLRCADRFGKKVMYIDELIVDEEVLHRMIAFVVEASYEAGVDAIYYEGLGEAVSSGLRRWAFIRRDNGHSFVVHSKVESLDKDLAERRNWNVTIADSDMGFRLDR